VEASPAVGARRKHLGIQNEKPWNKLIRNMESLKAINKHKYGFLLIFKTPLIKIEVDWHFRSFLVAYDCVLMVTENQ
jgi:hypothetical protein